MANRERMSMLARRVKTALVILLILIIALVVALRSGDRTSKATVALASPTKGLTVAGPPEEHLANSSPPASPLLYTEEVCGHGEVSTNLKGIDLTRTFDASDRTVGALAKDAAARWLLALQSSSDPHARAAGLFLQASLRTGDSAAST